MTLHLLAINHLWLCSGGRHLQFFCLQKTVTLLVMSPPLHTEVGTCWFTSVCRCLSGLSSSFHCAGGGRGGRPSKHETLTQCWANVGRVVFGTKLNVGHRRWANITQAYHWPGNVSVQRALFWCRAIVYDAGQHLNRIGALYRPTICIHSRQHEVGLLTRAKLIPASAGDACPAINRHWVGVSLYWPPAVSTARSACYWTQPSKHEALNQCWFDPVPASQTVGQHWTSIRSTSRVCWQCWQATLWFAHLCGSKTA